MENRKEQRQQAILNLLQDRQIPVSGSTLASLFGVSRQVIVQDIAVLKVNHPELVSTSAGYYCPVTSQSRVFHVFHEEERLPEELNLMCDNGGVVADVFIDHPIYGRLSAPLNLHNRREVREFVESLKEKNGQPLTMLTNGDHWHTVLAPDLETLDLIEEELRKAGFLLAEGSSENKE